MLNKISKMTLISHIGAGLALSLHGCIAIPVPSKMLEEYIPKDSLSFLEVGLTTKDEVVEKLAEPASTFSNGSKWIYRTNVRETGRTAGCSFIVHEDCYVGFGSHTYGLLDLDFDDRGVLSDWELLDAEYSRCSKEGVCVLGTLGESDIMVFAPESTDLAAKRFDVSGNDCAIYLHASELRPSTTMRVQIENVFDTWLRRSWETYLYRVLPAASYLIRTSYEYETTTKSIQFACNDGDVVFIRFVATDDGDYDLEVATESDGRAAIEHRRLILFEDITPLTSSP
jgi:hypothetical protein